MANELVIYTDESDRTGPYFSNFYGGALVRSRDLPEVIERLEACKRRHNLFNEIKWQKVTANYLGKYEGMVDELFKLVAAGAVKVRIMFTSNQYVPVGLTDDQEQAAYHLLYYQFIKHAFGLQYCAADLEGPIRVRLNIDSMPGSSEQKAQFKSFVAGLSHNPEMRAADVEFDTLQIAEVASHDHVVLQCLDVVLGAMTFRLNNKHTLKPPGASRRAGRTRAKHQLYQRISSRIREIYPRFNIGESTGTHGDLANRWLHPYRHWKLVPKEHERDPSKAKQ
jgi:hypothetical protein